MAYVNMAHMPKPATEYTVNFFELNGGLNVNNLEFRLTNKESPAMRNLIWREGVLCSREGQEWVVDDQLHELTKMEVSLAPTQDLHGYDHPWPAGGGKNLFNIDAEIGTPNPTDGTNTTSPRVLEFGKIYKGLRSDNYYYPQYATFSISGNTITVTNGSNNAYGAAYSFKVNGGENFTISGNSSTGFTSVGYYDSDWNYINGSSANSLPHTYQSPANASCAVAVFRAPANNTATFSDIQIEVGSTATTYAPYSNICPITGHSGADAYVKAAYDAGATPTVSVTFTDQGTVYGGTLDFVSGKLTVTHRYIVADGVNIKTTGGYGASGSKWLPCITLSGANIAVSGTSTESIISSYLKTTPYIQATENCLGIGNNGAVIPLHIGTMQGTDGTHGYNSANEVHAAVNAYLQQNPLQICYKLATPLVYNLTPQSIPAFSGQKVVWSDAGDVETQLSSISATAYTIYDRPFHEHLFAHIGTKIYVCDPEADTPAWDEVCSGVPEARGTFFHYYDDLFYKTAGGYFKITYSLVGTTPTFTGAAVDGYIPNTVINAAPSTGSGTLYQPENRIQSKKLVKYNAEADVTVYHLPVTNADSVDSVKVDGVAKTVGTDYTVNLTDGTVTFATAPPVTDPPTNNTVEITYSKANTDAYNAVMDCPYAITYGGTGDLCVVMGGCPAQPNAFFWNGNHIVMDATYFPMSNYQLAGDTDDMITGFGKQQSFLVVFKEHSIGRAKQNTEEIDGRVTVDMPYMAINDKIGCDLPWSIQLIDNNLVWCNTEQGVHILKDSSYAYENNIECVSLKVNKSSFSAFTLLNDVRSGTVVCSADDETHYWLVANGHAWLWDYENSHYKTPSWYFYTNIGGVAFATDHDDTWHINSSGRLTKFNRLWRDYGGPIDKSFRFTVQYFGGYDRLKNVNSVIFSLRPDTDSVTKLTYITDYESREDLTDLAHSAWRLVPRDLSYRNLAGTGFGAVFRRRPMCRRVKHFTMQLDNNVAGQDLSIVSAQIFYNYQGRLR